MKPFHFISWFRLDFTDGRKDILNIISEKVRIHTTLSQSAMDIIFFQTVSLEQVILTCNLKNWVKRISAYTQFEENYVHPISVTFMKLISPMVWYKCLCRILMEGKLYAMGAHLHVILGPLQAERITLWFRMCNLFIKWSFFRRLQELSSPINLASPLPSFPFRNDAEQFVERIW